MTITALPFADLTWDMIFDAAVRRTRLADDGDRASGYDLFSATRATQLMMADWRNRLTMLWTVQPFALALGAGVQTLAAPADADEMLEFALRDANGADYPLTVLGRTDYLGYVNKTLSARPTQVLVDRQLNLTNLTVYPVADRDYTLIGYYLRKNRAANAAVNVDAPNRFSAALVSGLALYLGREKAVHSSILEAWEAKLRRLEADYEKEMARAVEGDRNKSNLRLDIDMSMY